MSLRELLRRHDPAGIDPPLEGEDLARMRRQVVAAAVMAQGAPVRISWPLAAAAALVVVLLAAGGSLWRGGRPAHPAAPGEGAVRQTRQVQMVTPGGTRVVWVLNPDLNL